MGTSVGSPCTAHYLAQHGFSSADSVRAAYLHVYNLFQDQTRLLAFMDCFRFLGAFTLGVAPLVFFIRRFRSAGKAPSGH